MSFLQSFVNDIKTNRVYVIYIIYNTLPSSMSCKIHPANKYCYNNPTSKGFSIQITPGVANNAPYYTEATHNNNDDAACFMLYVILPMLYIIFATGNVHTIMLLWSFIQTGVFDAIQGVKQFLTNTVIHMLRVLGWYTVSTYTVVKDGREVFSATSEYFFMKTTRANIKSVDPAKYKVCKWIDNECVIYRRVNNDEEPELTETHNDIYDFIIHKCEHDTRARIHRGDFRISTHTSLIDNYRKFCKSYQLSPIVELHVTADDVNTEVIFIDMKYPTNFYVEKNIIVDKGFLRWYLYNKLGRKDLADYIGLPYSKYEVNMYYQDFMKDALADSAEADSTEAEAEAPAPQETQRARVFSVNDGQYVFVGNRYIVKVDAILGCPVVESTDTDVFHIDDILTNYYENSVCSDTDDDENKDDQDQEDDDSAVSESTDNDDTETDTDTETETETLEAETESPDPYPEFEIIEPSTD